jgi:hypothetical protein
MNRLASLCSWTALLAAAPLAASLTLAADKPARKAEVRPVKIGAAVGDLSFRDVSGRRFELVGEREEKATLFLFLSTQCPISNGYTSRLVELSKEYGERGVAVFPQSRAAHRCRAGRCGLPRR